MNPKKILLSTYILLSLFLLSSCFGTTDMGTSEIVRAMLNTQSNLPAGKLYTTLSTPGAEDYLSSELLRALYGTEGSFDAFGNAAEIAIRAASGLHANEFAVFRCRSRRDAEEIADLCLARIDTIEHFIRLNSDVLGVPDSDLLSAENAKVTIYGKYVIMALSKDADAAIEAAKDIIG